MHIARRPPAVVLVQAVAAAATFVIFASLAVRHVGGSVFLVDQADQLQFFERFLRLEPYGLLGPVMTGPDPPTRSAGPLGAWLFGIPVALGAGVDGVHAVTSIVMVLATLAAFVALASVDARLGWSWLLLVLANGIVWWNAGMLWANTLMLPAGCVLLACMAACLARPTFARWWSMWLAVLFAAHISLVAITALLPVAVVALRTGKAAWGRWPRPAVRVLLAVVTLLAVGPYVLSESMTGWANTRAMFAHADETRPRDAAAVVEYGLPVLQLAADPGWVMQRLGAGGWTPVAAGAVVALAALVLGALSLRTNRPETERRRDRAMLWLVVAAVVGIAGQAAFFVIENRALLSYHYVSMLLPLWAVPGAAAVAWLLAPASARVRDLAAVGLAAICVSVLWSNGAAWADRHFESTEWTFTNIAAAVDELCGPAGSARTIEGPGFDSLMPGHDGVITFMMTRRLVDCRYDRAGGRGVAASREGHYGDAIQDDGGLFRLVKVTAPGIALYRRDGAPPNQ